MEPATLTATAIAAIAFTKSVEVAAEKLTEGTIALLKQLREKIAGKLQGKKKAEEALQQLEAGDEAGLEQVIPYLQVEMNEDEEFAREVQQLAQTIRQQMNVSNVSAKAIQNVIGNAHQYVETHGEIFSGNINSVTIDKRTYHAPPPQD